MPHLIPGIKITLGFLLGVTISKQVYVKRGALMYLTSRRDARSDLEAGEQALGEKLAAMKAVAFANADRNP